MQSFRILDAGSAQIRAVVKGTGPLVVMVHGFPESWYSWRHQIDPIADAGFTACAIDVRGYGGSQKFGQVEDYAMEHMIADILGVAEALAPGQKFILVGHDWGAPMVWQTSLLHPDRIAAVAALSVIHSGVGEQSFDDVIKAVFDDQNIFFLPGGLLPSDVGEGRGRVFDVDPRDFLRRFYYRGIGRHRPDPSCRRPTRPLRTPCWTGCPTRIRSRPG